MHREFLLTFRAHRVVLLAQNQLVGEIPEALVSLKYLTCVCCAFDLRTDAGLKGLFCAETDT
jgi:hypothetical protein